jgi:hypothetical protein
MLSNSSDGSSVLLLDTAFVSQPVNTHIFAPFLIARLEEHADVHEKALDYQVTLHDIGAHGERTVPLRLAWTEPMIPPVPLAAQREYITEAAACGLAFALLAHFTAATLVDVADRGDRFDYIVSENGVRLGVEISGSQAEEKSLLRDRHGQKIRQLLENPHQWGGYVVIVGFTRREVILSYHLVEEVDEI